MKQVHLPDPPQKYDPVQFKKLVRAIEAAILQLSVPDPGTILGSQLVATPTLGGNPVLQTAAAAESTGGGTASLDTNCPAVTPGTPYKWLALKTSDGSTVFLPVWK